jgi:hypothetical protein
VKEWFNQKVEEVLGLGMMIWQLLKQGGMSLAQIGQMAWEGIKAAIPPALIQILIEKLVSMIVPAAGAVMAIVEGLQAAWGTVSRILQAIEKFMAFMKAVKSGGAGPQFGAMLAAAGIVLIDFVSNWLLKRVRGAASKVGGKLKAIAKKIGDKLKKAAKKVGQKLKGAAKKVGQKLKGAAKKVRDKFGKLKEKFFGKKKDKDGQKKRSKEESEQEKIQKHVEKVQRELPPKLHKLLANKPSKLRVLAQLAIWRVAYRLRKLEAKGEKGKIDFTAQVNPTIDLGNGWEFDDYELFRIIDKIAADYVDAAPTSEEAAQTPGESATPISLDERAPRSPVSNLSRHQEEPHLQELSDTYSEMDRGFRTFYGKGAVAEADQGSTSSTSGKGTTPTFLNVRHPGIPVANLRIRESYRVGQTESGEPLGYKHQPAKWGGWFGWQEIAGLEFGEGYKYTDPKGGKDLRTILKDVPVGEMLTKIQRGEPVPLQGEQKDALGVLFGLWFAKEPKHASRLTGFDQDVPRRRDLVYSHMLTDLMTPRQGKSPVLDVEQALDLHPAAFGGAQMGAKQVTAEMLGKHKTTSEKLLPKREERYRREKETLIAWFKQHTKDLPVLDRKPTINDVESFVRQKLLQYRNQ